MKFTQEFIKAALVRALKTAAQVALGMFTVGQMFSDIDWLKVISVAGVSALYSILTSIVGGLPETSNSSDGELIIDTSSDSEDIFRLEIDKPLAEIQPGDKFVLHVKED